MCIQVFAFVRSTINFWLSANRAGTTFQPQCHCTLSPDSNPAIVGASGEECHDSIAICHSLIVESSAARWQEALEAGCAPKVYLEACHESALAFGISLEDLKAHSVAV
jgi:hypothetical protein